MSEQDFGYASAGPNVWLIEEMRARYLENPNAVGARWREFFADQEGDDPPAPSSPPVAPPPREVPEGGVRIAGPAEILARNMEASLTVPTATSVRTMPVTLLQENRRLANRHLQERQTGRLSFTHVIAWAVVKALTVHPALRTQFRRVGEDHYRIVPDHIHLGIAVDVTRRDGSRGLVVPVIRHAEGMDFTTFFAAYNTLIRRAQHGQLTPEDFVGTSVSITNPGTVGTQHSVPRLMEGQSAIIGVGAIDWPTEWKFADPRTRSRLGVGRVVTLTSTYDHRVIQGAESGQFLDTIERLLLGEHDFYDEIFRSLAIPFFPFRLTPDANPGLGMDDLDALLEKQARVLQLINKYRVRGHLQAHLDPLSDAPRPHVELDPAGFGVTIWDLDREFVTGGLASLAKAPLRDILDTLWTAYCRTLGIEYMHIQEPDQRRWITAHVEGRDFRATLDTAAKHRILDRLIEAEAFEHFLHTRYVGHKRFSLEGAEVLIPALDHLLRRAGHEGIEQTIMGMAHRGRLNVLATILGRSFESIFREFDGNIDPDTIQGSGDVKYHVGGEGDYAIGEGRTVRVRLASNPSHLEAVDPVVEGMVRAAQDALGEGGNDRVLPILIHGDAAFAGQGVVAETLNFSMLSGYRTGGTVHIVLDNGIGFTTSSSDARSSQYPTDVAKMIQAPVFHVNGDDPEAVLRAVELALDFRMTFHKDTIVHILCYRRHGHNEADDPSYTQPRMVARIRGTRSVRKLYTETLVNRGDLSVDEAESSFEAFHALLDRAFEATRESAPPRGNVIFEARPEIAHPSPETGVGPDRLDAIVDALTSVPATFSIHPKLPRQFEARRTLYDEGRVDWALAEALAFGTLLQEGTSVRLSGQDSRRGTFSQRHAVWVDYETGAPFTPLNALGVEGKISVYDSLLSEYAVLGFEYGYSIQRPEMLVLWEAQFGDFINGAQIIIDQFLASAEDKWGQKSGLVLLLPHGFEGQGPEHSSARIERILTLSAENNMRIVQPTTAAQYFHVLRRQIHVDDRKPLVVMTPKSLLRSEGSRSPLAELHEGGFRLMLDDPHPRPEATRILLSTGKVAQDLLVTRDQIGDPDTVILRLEQLYPFPYDDFRILLSRYPRARDIRWVQEEPENMGAWTYVFSRLRNLFEAPYHLSYVGRLVSGSPATGSSSVHELEQQRLVQEAFS